MSNFTKHRLDIIVFIAGALVMVLEIVGARILAPFFGTSIIVWTSIIGIVLGSLSLGYAYGGKLADKQPTYATLGKILLLSACALLAITLLSSRVLEAIQGSILDIRIAAVVSALFVFGVPSVLLGMVSPYAVKLKLHNLDLSGSTVGNLYALSTLGSIVGTFLSGFVLLAFFRVSHILYGLVMTLFILSLLSHVPKNKKVIIALLCISFAGFLGTHVQDSILETRGVYAMETPYQHIEIHEGVYDKYGKPIRGLFTGTGGIQSAVFLDEPNRLVFDYNRFFTLVDHFHPDPTRTLMIGGGAYTYPRHFLASHPSATMDVIEIDPALEKIAKDHFYLTDNDRMSIVHEDGRTFLNRTNETYDIIFLDVFKSDNNLPFHLTTQEAAQLIHDRLEDDGIVMVNMISAVDGPKGQFLRSEYATFASVFNQVYIFPIGRPDDLSRHQNIMLVALKSDEAPLFESKKTTVQEYLDTHLPADQIDLDMPILTDDFAPVDQYTISILTD